MQVIFIDESERHPIVYGMMIKKEVGVKNNAYLYTSACKGGCLCNVLRVFCYSHAHHPLRNLAYIYMRVLDLAME